jgi:hypothetical protein
MSGPDDYLRVDIPRGMGCLDCRRVLPEGSPYSRRLVSVTEDEGGRDWMFEVVCVYCIIAPAQYCPDSVPDTLEGLVGGDS